MLTTAITISCFHNPFSYMKNYLRGWCDSTAGSTFALYTISLSGGTSYHLSRSLGMIPEHRDMSGTLKEQDTDPHIHRIEGAMNDTHTHMYRVVGIVNHAHMRTEKSAP